MADLPPDEDEYLAYLEEVGTEQDPFVADGEMDAEKKIQYARERAERDFFYFARFVLGFDRSKIEYREQVKGREIKKQRIQEGPQWGISALTPHKKIVDILTCGATKVHVEAPRGTYKSTLLLCWAAWNIVINANVRIFYSMDTHRQAKKRVAKVRQFLESNVKIRELWPHIEVAPAGSGAFICSNRTDPTIVDPTMEAGGPDCDFTGSHFDIIILDDIVNFKNVRTADGLENSVEFFNMVQPLLDPGGILAAIGTRYHEQDLWSEILNQSTEFGGEWECLVLDCGMDLYQKEDKTWALRGEPIFPFLDEKVLYGILNSKSQDGGHRTFSSQYLNRCLSADEQIFYRENFKPARRAEWHRHINWYVLTDTAVTKNDKSCFSVVALVGVDGMDHAWLAKLHIGHWKPSEFRDYLFHTLEWADNEQYKVKHVVMEKTTANTVFETMFDEEAIRRKMRVRYAKLSRGLTDQSKNQRIQGLDGRMGQGRFHVLDTVDHYYQDLNRTKVLFDPYGWKKDGPPMPSGELVDQFIKFPSSKWKDIPDALADLEAKDKDGQRVCKGRGHKGDVQRNLGARVGQVIEMPSMPKQIQTRSQRGSGDQRAARAAQIQAHGGRYQ